MLHDVGVSGCFPARQSPWPYPIDRLIRLAAAGAINIFLIRPDRKKPADRDLDLPVV